MENQQENQELLTNAKENAGKNVLDKKADDVKKEGFETGEEEIVKGVLLSAKDADEFRAYKRRKIVEEIMAGMQRSEAPIVTETEMSKVCERALRLKQPAVRMSLARFPSAQKRLGKSAVKFDCIIGGNGETATKVKMYEAKLAIKNYAKELTVVIAPSFIRSSQFEEIRRELRMIRRMAGKRVAVKARVDGEWPFSVLSRLARLVSEVGMQFFSVKYFVGCERLRFDLLNGCKLEVSDVQTLTDFKKLLSTGVGRIVTDCAWEIYGAWMQEADKMEFAKRATLIKEREPSFVRSKDPSQKMPPDLPMEQPREERPSVEPKPAVPLPASKVMQAEGISEQKPVAAGIESSDLKFI